MNGKAVYIGTSEKVSRTRTIGRTGAEIADANIKYTCGVVTRLVVGSKHEELRPAKGRWWELVDVAPPEGQMHRTWLPAFYREIQE